MFLNERDIRYSEERRKDLWREAKRERLARQSRRDQRQPRKTSPLWARVWVLFF
ncbi:MAG TPA: hypothetical protein VHD90_10220 [Phototrophicaceae bacterium]|nr:hypothetical protein [Phototrophicaceae bacterium]